MTERQDRKFIATIVENLPDIDKGTKQYWIENPKALQRVLANTLSSRKLFVPEEWKVESHKEEAFETDPSKITLYLSEGQKKGTVIGFDLQKDLESQLVLNACTLDYFIAHPELIPKEWRGKAIFFFGTIYSDSNGHLCVRCLWGVDDWGWEDYYLYNCFDSHNPAACLKVA